MEKKLCVKMFGVFSASYGDTVFTFGKHTDSKFSQLFQLLMTRPGQDFSKKNITQALYGCGEVENSNASLNNTIFRLRKYLKESPLPPGEYLSLNKGVLRFGGEIEVESDVWSFECAVRELEREPGRQKKIESSSKACMLYQGEFLPQLSSEMWVIEKRRTYHEMYSRVLNDLLRCLKEEGDFNSVNRLAGRAAEIYPDEGWENWQVESLAALGRYKEAEQVYQEAAARAHEAGGFLSREQQMKLRKMGAWIRRPEETAEDIGKCLMEHGALEGAYSCTLPGFSDCLHMLKRVTAREGTVRFILLLCTMLDSSGHPTNDPGYCRKQEGKLRKIFKERLRKGDIYTKFSEGQYLLLCFGVKNENALEIGARIDMDFRKQCGGRRGIRCLLLDDRDL